MKIYIKVFALFLVALDLYLLYAYSQLKSENRSLLLFANTVGEVRSNYELVMSKYYKKPLKLAEDHPLGNYLSKADSQYTGIVFRYWKSACDPCVKEQMGVIKAKYEELYRVQVPIKILADEVQDWTAAFVPDSLMHTISISSNWDEKIRGESAYYYWIDQGVISHMFFPMANNVRATLNYFDFIKSLQ